MKFFNPTLESFKWQCDNRIFVFPRRDVVDIDDQLISFIEDQCKDRGIFALRHGIDFRSEERRALIHYLRNNLDIRIERYKAWQYDLKTRGVEVADPIEFKQVQRWKKELEAKLEMEAPIDESLSYLTDEQREKIGITDQAVYFEGSSNIFDGFNASQNIETFDIPKDNGAASYKKLNIGTPKKRGRPFSKPKAQPVETQPVEQVSMEA